MVKISAQLRQEVQAILQNNSLEEMEKFALLSAKVPDPMALEEILYCIDEFLTPDIPPRNESLFSEKPSSSRSTTAIAPSTSTGRTSKTTNGKTKNTKVLRLLEKVPHVRAEVEAVLSNDRMDMDAKFDALSNKMDSMTLLELLNAIDEEREVPTYKDPLEEHYRQVQEAEEAKKNQVPKPKPQHDCPVCIETFDEREMVGCVGTDDENRHSETHFMCEGCAADYAKALVTDGVLGEGGAGLKCGAAADCTRIVLWGAVRHLLDADTVARVEKRIDSMALAQIEGMEYCKLCGDYGLIIEQTVAQMQYFQCAKPQCGGHFCRKCKVDHAQHNGKTCDEVDPKKREKARLDYEESLTKAIVRVCPKCSTQFVKEAGCNKMTCGSCGTTMCYLCRAVNINYDHFKNGGCETHANSNAYDADKLNQIRQRAKGNVLTKDIADRL